MFVLTNNATNFSKHFVVIRFFFTRTVCACVSVQHVCKHAQGSSSHRRRGFSNTSTGTSKPPLLQPICRRAGCLLSSHMSTSPCICKTRSFGAEMQTDSCMTEKMLRPQRHYDLHSIGQGSWFAITPAHPLANAQGKGSGHKHGEKPQGQEGSSWETTKPPVSPGLSLCST